jgi:sterol desaturase/sphingolipid hydroxylase (fatty acid hydroxylase superfamily)
MTDIHTFVIYPFSCSFAVYWGLSFLFYLCDVKLDNKKYRIEENIDWVLYKKTFFHVLYLQFAYSLPIMYALIPVWKWRGNTIDYQDSNYTDVIKLVSCGLLGESIFFYLHYWSHFILYSKIHKVHHEWKNTCAIAAAYAHPIEYVMVSLPSFLIPPIITGINWQFSNIWFIIATTSVVIDHSGYNIIDASKFHWDHHKYSNVNYGTNTIGDVIHFVYTNIKNLN